MSAPLPEGYNFRRLQISDYDNHYLETLAVLTTVGDISKTSFEELVHHWDSLSSIYNPQVITNEKGQIVSTGMLMVEKKMIHEGGLVGHIEDISVNKSEQGKRLGYAMITNLLELGKNAGCYKVILDCSEHNVAFYEKCGLKKEGVEMGFRF